MAISAGVALGIVCNITCVVCVVLTNKYIFKTDGFRYMVTLSAMHFAVTAVATRALLLLGLFKYKLPLGGHCRVLPLAMTSLGSVGFMNLNLAHNSVGFYQMSKLACVPATLVVQWLLYRASTSSDTKLTLIPILIGIGKLALCPCSSTVIAALASACVPALSLSTSSTTTSGRGIRANSGKAVLLCSVSLHSSPMSALNAL